MPHIANVNDDREPLVLQDDADQGISPGEVLRMLWRHKLFILLSTVVCFALALAYVTITHPVFEATATIRIDPGRTSSLGLSDLSSGGGTGDTSDLIHTEIAIMQSDGVALRTLRDLPDAEFQQLTGETKKEAALPDAVQNLTPDQSDLLAALQGPLTIKQEEGTSLINMNFRNRSPKLAADVVNRLVDSYFVQSFVDRDRSVSQLDGWLATQMVSLKNQVDIAQRQLSDFEQKNHVLPTDGSASGGSGTGNSITDRLRLISDRLTSAQSDRIVKEGQLRAAQNGDLAVLAALFPTSRLQALQGEQTSVSSRYEQLHSKFGANYPPLTEAAQQLKAINAEVTQEIGAIRGRLQEEYNAAKTTEDLLRQEYDQQTNLAFAFDRNDAEFAVLQAEVTSSRTLYDTLKRNIQQAGINAQVNGLNTMAVDYAHTPSYAVAPKRTLILGGGLVLGLFAGIAAALLLEANSDNLHTASQLGQAAAHNILVSVPAIGRKQRGQNEGVVAHTLSRTDVSNSAEAFRALRNMVLLKAATAPFKSILFTAPTRGEQVGELILNTAVALAEANKRVLLVDADLYEPSLHRAFNDSGQPGLADLLTGTGNSEIYRQPLQAHPNFVLLPAGTVGPEAIDALIQEPFESALRQWQADFDFVLVKIAPPLQQSSGLLLARFADRVLLLARYQTTQVRAFREVSLLLNRAGARLLGVVVENAPQPQ